MVKSSVGIAKASRLLKSGGIGCAGGEGIGGAVNGASTEVGGAD